MRSPLAITAAALLSALPLLQPATGRAQEAPVAYSAIRALNLARNTAVKLNGGLSVYMPAACMFSSGGSGGSCLAQTNSQGFLFRFNGGTPGWQQLGKPPTLTTEILISPDGRTVSKLVYNGPLR